MEAVVKKVLLFGLVMVLALGAFALVGCGGEAAEIVDEPVVEGGEELAPDVQAIKDRGVLRVGVKNDVPHLGLLNPATDEYEGLEIDMAWAIAKEIIGDDAEVEFTAVTADTRGDLLDNGQIDMVIATFTIKPDRLEKWNFSDPYAGDPIGFLVNTASGISELADLDGKNIGVALGSSTQEGIENDAQTEGMSFTFTELDGYPALNTALAANQIDAFSVDKSILRGYLADDRALLEISLTPQHYGIATKLGNDGLATLINDFVNRIKADGTLDQLLVDNGAEGYKLD